MILSGQAMHQRLGGHQIFKEGTWVPESLKEASYALRVAPDGLMLEGNHCRPGEERTEGDINIQPGKIAILSTIERLDMPGDLVGKIGIRFKYACQGLTGLMGIQVDPFYGWGRDDERLYIRVANLGNDPISIPVGDEVFTFELHAVSGSIPEPSVPRIPMWHRILDTLSNQNNASWSNVTRIQLDVAEVQADLDEQETRLNQRVDSARSEIKDYLQPLVMFGIFLVAVTILGVSLTLIVTGLDTPEVYVPAWVTNWGWILLVSTLCVATLATAAMGSLTSWRLLKQK